jgi:biotin/methionine sulfoxide reductase
VLSKDVRPGVAQLSTGAWYDPLDPSRPGSLEKHGNPNALTLDKGTSKLAQGPIAHSCLVEIEPWSGPLPPVTAFAPPATA